ncbi:MAG: Flp pilus assembly complex ATPase component TadA [Desulfobacteraceae bacterium]|nr:Flp pilus assembly complex ATPase component TadA [Desulfobacteraceae bacterium]MBC2720726.1 Flp pilus assembly complex ATPase component TadA [Desulfobacteraceae bacterium]
MLLGEILVKNFGVDPVDVEKALQFQANFEGMLGSILINMGIISEETLVFALSDQLNLKTFKDININEVDFRQPPALKNVNIPFLLQRCWLPLNKKNGTVFFAAANPLDYEVTQYLNGLSMDWDTYLVTESQFRELESEHSLAQETNGMGYPDISDMLDTEIDKLRELASEAPIVNLVNTFIARAVSRGASDLHFEPYKNMYRVRFRIDGILHDIDFLPLKMQLPVASRIKILSGMDISERRKPQDGQISMKVSSKELDIRVSTLPLADGESLVLRFLVKEAVKYELETLGLETDLAITLKKDIFKSSGVILLVGPTGSGKTTTLYSCLNKINSEDKKIITIEDPVEYHLDGINQIQVRPEIGYGFLNALRSILRQDPDIIMIGEIRDGETARIAMQSSLTGHLVFSTVHTNDAPSAYMRLIDLGVEEYLINSSLISIIAQRLVRRVCRDCTKPAPLDYATIKTYGLDVLAEKYNLKTLQAVEAVGCLACNQTGYKGRVGIMEYLKCTPEIKTMPKDSGFSLNARKYMSDNNIRSLTKDGFLKVIKGITTIDEVLRVSG